MKRYFLLFAVLLCGCRHSELQSKAEGAAEMYIKSGLNNTKYFKSVSFSTLQKRRYTTALDTNMQYAGANADTRQNIEKYVDSENGQRPDLRLSNDKDIYDIEHNKLSYYLLIYSFRIDSAGQKKYRKYRFELDTACNVIKATDITNSRSMQEE